jgi:hypothetical protein
MADTSILNWRLKRLESRRRTLAVVAASAGFLSTWTCSAENGWDEKV